MYAAIPLLPLFAALVAGFGAKFIGDRGSQLVTCGAMLLAAAIGIVAFIDVALGHHTQTIELFRWIRSGSFDVAWALKLDTLTAVMLVVVTVVSSWCMSIRSAI